jgi:hypothetical protein
MARECGPPSWVLHSLSNNIVIARPERVRATQFSGEKEKGNWVARIKRAMTILSER